MTLYMDKYKGVWNYNDRNRTWTLISSNGAHRREDFIIGSIQNNESVKHLSPFMNIDLDQGCFGDTFDFPPEPFITGRAVWVDQEWLEEYGADHTDDYVGNPPRVAGIVKEYIEVLPDQVLVSIDFYVPRDKVTYQ